MLLLAPRDIWSSAPPQPRSEAENWPTVLFSWWTTSFSAVIILARLCGRKVRSDRLFREDNIMMFALIPLFIRMILIHFVLIYGTNNVETLGIVYTAEQLEQRSIGARLVLPARIFYAMYIWLCKLCVSEFLKRITIRIWRQSYEFTLQIIRGFLLVSFIAVVIATLTECQPFDHYWQVVPDPGAHCRQGYGFLLTMSVCDIVTDLLLITFPIPVVLRSGQTWKRKLQMVSLFSLSSIMIAVTATRVPKVVDRHGLQQYRTVWASCEILAATFVSNGVILGSFLRDKGTKKNRYRLHSVSDSIERAPTRRPTLRTIYPDDSEEDLFSDMGWRMPDHLREEIEMTPRLAPLVPSAPTSWPRIDSPMSPDLVTFAKEAHGSGQHAVSSVGSEDYRDQQPVPMPTPRNETFFDIGNLLNEEDTLQRGRRNDTNTASSATQSSLSTDNEVADHEFAQSNERILQPGSQTFLQDIGGLSTEHEPRRRSRGITSTPNG